MRAQSPQPRRFRLQVSLRMLLVVMVLIGVAHMVYRWPWVERNLEMVADPEHAGAGYFTGYRGPDDHQLEIRTSYRRNLQGEPVQHGPEQIWLDNRLRYEVHYYDGIPHGRRRDFAQSGEVTVEGNYRNGLLSGPLRAGDGRTWFFEGSFRAGIVHGECTELLSHRAHHETRPNSFQQILGVHQTIFPGFWSPEYSGPEAYYGHDLIRITTWRDGVRHGPAKWKTPTGEVLNTAEYDQNHLVRWNGEPVVEQFREWIRSTDVNNPELAAALLADYDYVDMQPPSDAYQAGLLSRDLRITLGSSNASSINLVAHLETPVEPSFAESFWWLQVLDGNNAVPLLCEFAAIEGYGFQHRYGALWLVSRVDPEPPFVDPTGIDRIQFVAGSQEAADWDELIDVHESTERVVGCVRQLLAGTALKFVAERVEEPVPGGEGAVHSRDDPSDCISQDSPPPTPFALPSLNRRGKIVAFRRSRRNALGYVLYRAGCKCELQDGQLVIVPRDNRTEAQSDCRPLERAPEFFR